MKNFGRFTYYGSLGGYSHVWSTTDPPIYGARILLNEAGNTYVALRGEEHPEPTSEEIAEARALVASKDFGRFKYRGKSGKVEHVWSTGKNKISGARIALNKDGSIHHISGPVSPVSKDPKPTEAEITEARAKIGIEEAQVQHSSFEEALRTQHSKWDFGRFKYRGKFEIQNNYMPIESKHTWVTDEPLGAKIGLREDGSLSFTCETNGHPEPTAFEIAKAQSLVKHELAGERIQDIPMRTSSKSVRGSSPNIQRMLRTPRERTRIPDFSRLGSVVGPPLIRTTSDSSSQNFGRFKYCGKVGDKEHVWATPNNLMWRHTGGLLYGAWIFINADGSLDDAGAYGKDVKAPTKEEIYTSRNMVMAANLVKQGEKEERPNKCSFGVSEPPVDIRESRVFKQLLNVLKPKESKPLERAKIDPRPVYRIKPHVLSLPLLDPSTHARHHCLYTERYDVFKITGLAMWGISEDTTLNVHIGGLAIFDGDVPAQMFANGLSFHALYQILELKEPPDRIVSQDVPEDLLEKLRLNVKWRELEAGLIPPLKIHQNLELNISGPAKYAVFWGYRRELVNG